MSIVTFDHETTYGTSYGRVGNPFSGEHKLCSTHQKIANGHTTNNYFVQEVDGVRTGGYNLCGLSIPDDCTLIIGANIKFDILWSLMTPGSEDLMAFFRRGGRIFDVLYAEYLLTGQLVSHSATNRAFTTNLNNVARLNGFKPKLDAVKALWDEGVRTEDIPVDILLPYGDRDVDLTHEVAMKQLGRAGLMGPAFIANMWSRMEGLLATTFMEFNGLCVDYDEGVKQAAIMDQEIAKMTATFMQYVPQLPAKITDTFNPGSSKQLSAFMFGGVVKYTGRVNRTDSLTGDYLYVKKEVPLRDGAGNLVKYIRGKRKGEQKYIKVNTDEIDLKNGDVKIRFKGFIKPMPGHTPNEEGQYSTAAEIMDDYAALYPDSVPISIIQKLRKMSKDVKTYYIHTAENGNQKGMLTTVNPDGLIHHSLNHYVTTTTRLSSSAPNMQNIPNKHKSQVKKLFKSRFQNGVMVEIDYSQLEVICKAVLSKDPQLIQDCLDGIDKHCLNLSFAENIEYKECVRRCKDESYEAHEEWAEKRSGIKPYTFQTQYGGGKLLMAKSTGRSVEDIEKVLAKNAERYPGEAEFDAYVLATAKDGIQNSPFLTAKHRPAGVGYYRCVTGAIYGFLESDAPKWLQDRDEVFTSIKPTQTKNFPSQGLGGFIMQDALGAVIRFLLSQKAFAPYVKLCNSVHDCLWLDIATPEIANQIVPIIKGIMEDVVNRFTVMFGDLGWPVQFKAEAEAGPNMYSLHKFKEVA